MPISSHYLQVTERIPAVFTPADIVSALHHHENCIMLQSLTTGYKEVTTSEEDIAGDRYFWPSQQAPIKSYIVTEGVIIIPGIGDWGRKFIDFPAWFQNTSRGVRTRALAPMGITVRAEWSVRPEAAHEGSHQYSREGSMGSAWLLVEDVTVECSSWLMPFVKRSMEGAHRDICRVLVEKLLRDKHGANRPVGGGTFDSLPQDHLAGFNH